MEFHYIMFAFLGGVLPTFLWLWFWLKEDNLHPEPRTLIIFSFLGGCLTVIIAAILENMVKDVFDSDTFRYIAWAGIEEVVKFGAVALIALRSRYLDEPIDIMIYCITVALGFAAVENTLYIYKHLEYGQITQSIVTGNLRFIGATLLHIAASASVGFMIAIFFYKKLFLKIIGSILGIILATTLHASFNLAIIRTTGTDTLKIFLWVWCAIVILIILFEEVKGIKAKEVVRV